MFLRRSAMAVAPFLASSFSFLAPVACFCCLPGEKVQNLLAYLVRQGRIWECEEYFCAAPECAEDIDRGLLATVWVLADFIDRVEYHSVGDFPAKIIFFADGEIYEIVRAAQGKETLVSHILSDPGEQPSKYPTGTVAIEIKRSLAKDLEGREFQIDCRSGVHSYIVLQGDSDDWHEFDVDTLQPIVQGGTHA